MRVAVYSSAFPPSIGGVERFGATLARWLVAHGHEVAVITSTPGPVSDAGVRIFRGGSSRELARIVRSADVVHVSGLSAKGIGWARAFGRRPVVTHHGYQSICPAGLAWSPAGECTAGPGRGPCSVCPTRRASGTIDVSVHRAAAAGARASVFVSTALRARVGLSGKVIYNPVDVPTSLVPGADGGGTEIAFVGRLVREKGLDVLLRALRVIPDARLRVAGDGPLRADWRRLADDLGVGSRTAFLGARSAVEVGDLYASSDVVCIPSLWGEPFGYSAAEAMALGRPVVGLPTGALPELLGGGRGFLADFVSPEPLAAVLRSALGDAEARRQAGGSARAFAEREFAADVVGSRYLDVYEAGSR
jgi:glycosyltransferase involved in cell wall biosynthesis